MLYLWLGARRPTSELYNSGMVSQYYLGWPLCLHRWNSASKNLQQEPQLPKCCLYKTPYVAAPIRETGDVIVRTLLYAQLPTDAPTRARILFWFTCNAFLKRPVLLQYWLQCAFSMRKPHAKAVPRKDFFTHLRTLKNMRKGRWVISPNYRITSTALLCRWGSQLLKDKMSLGTDFEMHARWQKYVEDPAVKDFVARKTCTIALSEAQGTQQSTLFTSLEIPWGFLTWAILCSLAGLMSRKKVSVWGF
jgi:hypothetical protein